MAERSLEKLRERIRRLDQELLARAAERVELARQVGDLKRRESLPTVDYAQEVVVLRRAREVAQELGLEPGVAEDLLAPAHPRLGHGSGRGQPARRGRGRGQKRRRRRGRWPHGPVVRPV